jgi:UDP-N-acetylmuramyl pentapeptide phosphotransferase/UDP-N-acetylglucosamine-1-phosphate transferase
LDHNLRIYAWFLLLVTVLPAAARLMRPRELAKILLIRYQDPGRRKRARFGGYFFLAVSLVAMPFAIRAPHPESTWLTIALLVGIVSSVEFVLDSRLFEEERLARQNRYFGGLYASIAIANLLLLTAR